LLPDEPVNSWKPKKVFFFGFPEKIRWEKAGVYDFA